MRKFFKRFTRQESGAVTVDWVIITAGVVGMSTVIYLGIEQSSTDLSGRAAAGVDTQGFY